MIYCPFCILRSKSDSPPLAAASTIFNKPETPEVQEAEEIQESPGNAPVNQAAETLPTAEMTGTLEDSKALEPEEGPETDETPTGSEEPGSAEIDEAPSVLEIQLTPEVSRVVITFEKFGTPQVKKSAVDVEVQDALENADLSETPAANETSEMLESPETAETSGESALPPETPEDEEPDILVDISDSLKDNTTLTFNPEPVEPASTNPDMFETPELAEDIIIYETPVFESYKVAETQKPASQKMPGENDKLKTHQTPVLPGVLIRTVTYRTRRKHSAFEAIKNGRKRRYRIIARDPITTITSRNARLSRHFW